MTTWIRRSFDGIGVTQVPPGPHLAAVQQRYGGTVMLCIDVSGSMDGAPVLAARGGAREFVAEAVAAHYRVGLMLWNTHVVRVAQPSTDGAEALAILDGLTSASGGNDLIGPLQETHRILGPATGDRVVALFGDGDLSPKARVLEQVAVMKAENIRFVTRGLGATAAREFELVSDEEGVGAVEVSGVEHLASGIASMAASLRRGMST